VITWGQYGGIYKGLAGKTLEIQIRFRSRRKLLRGHRTHKTSCPLEIRSFEAIDASDRNWDKKIAENLNKLKNSIERESRNWMRRLDNMREERTADQDADLSDDEAGDGEKGGEADGN